MASFFKKITFRSSSFMRGPSALHNSIRASGKKTGCVLTLSSPLLLTDLNINNPTSEVVFLPGKALGFLTEKIFENETGQSVMLGLFLLSLGLTSIYFHGLTARTVRQMQIYQATKFGQIGHPYYTVKAIPQNPLLKAKKI